MKGIVRPEQVYGFYDELCAAPTEAARRAIVRDVAILLAEEGVPDGESGGGGAAHFETHTHTRADGATLRHQHAHEDHEDADHLMQHAAGAAASGDHGERHGHDDGTSHAHPHGDHDAAAHLALPGHENVLPGGGSGADAGQLANERYYSQEFLAELAADSGRSGDVYDLAPTLADVRHLVDGQTRDYAAASQQDAADVAEARDLATRGHRIRAEDRLEHLLNRVRLGTYAPSPGAQDWENAALAASAEEWEDLGLGPDDMAAMASVGIHHDIATDFWRQHTGTRVRRLADPDADEPDATIEGLMPDVGAYSGYLRTQGG